MSNAIETINAVADVVMPATGKADTEGGEVVRAICRIGYRWLNDGDMLAVDYGNETCNPAGRYLAVHCDERVAGTIARMWGTYLTDDEYDDALDDLAVAVVEWLDAHPDAFARETEDMFSHRKAEDWDWVVEEAEDWDW